MKSGSKPARPALQDCLNLLHKALEIVLRGSRKYYLKAASEVSKEALNEVDTSLVTVSILLNKFISCWIDSKRSGPDAIVTSPKLGDRIDIKLIRTGKLDFEQFGKIMTRMNRADDTLLGLNRIALYIHYFQSLCAEKKLNTQAETANLFIQGVLNRAIDGVKWDAERLGNQINRCNLYFQNVLKSKTFKVAIGSLLVSSLAVLLTILNAILPHILNLLADG